ncbi:hypothetical protein Hanom_Chr16g01513331 [Helianthus anomalus]
MCIYRALNEQEPGVLKIHLEQFLLPAVPADPTAYITVPPPSEGGNVAATEKKTVKVKITGRKYMAVRAGASSVSVTAPAGSAAELASPAAGVQIENVSSAPLASVGTIPSAAGKPSLSDLISQASAAAAVSCPMPPPMPTISVAVTTSPVSTPLLSSKETPTVFAAHEPTSTQDAAISDAGGSSSGIADDGVRFGDDLHLPTINWDPNMQYKRYQPKWKIADSSRLIFPPVIQHRVKQAYPPAELAYVEGLNNENLMNSTIVDSVIQPRRLAEIRRRWMHDNNELHQARAVIEELKDEKYRLESQLQATGLGESRFVSEKNKSGDDLKRVTANLAEEQIIWARNIAEKDRVLAHAKNVQEELERKAITEA